MIVDRSRPVGGRAPDIKVFKEEQAARSVCQAFKDYRVQLYGGSGFDGPLRALDSPWK